MAHPSELQLQVEDLLLDVAEAEETLSAIRRGVVDAVVVSGAEGQRICTLQEANRPYKLLVEAMNEGAALLTADGLVLYGNPRFADLVGRAPEELVGVPFRELISPASRRRFDPLLESARQEANRFEIDLWCGGHLAIPVQLSLSPAQLDGLPVLCAIATDLAVQRRHDDLIRLQGFVGQLNRGLELQQVLERTLAAVGELQRSTLGILRLHEPATRSLRVAASLGLSDELLAGLGPVPERTGPWGVALAEARPVLVEALAEERACREHLPGVLQLGQRAATILPLLDQRGAVLGTIETFFTERHLPSERELRLVELFVQQAAHAVENAALHRETQRAVQARDRFMWVASHELRSPLGALVLQLHTLKRLLGKPLQTATQTEQVLRLLERAERQGLQLGQLVDNLLDLSRIGAGQLELALEEFDLAELARSVVERFAEQVRAAGSPLDVRLESVRGSWDRIRLEQILTNLVSNAIKYGDGKPLGLEVRGDATSARLVVTDQGIGMTAEFLSRLFTPFERAVRSGPIEGLGLGLVITRDLVEAHGGSIEVESQPGEGSRFTVVLPRMPPKRP